MNQIQALAADLEQQIEGFNFKKTPTFYLQKKIIEEFIVLGWSVPLAEKITSYLDISITDFELDEESKEGLNSLAKTYAKILDQMKSAYEDTVTSQFVELYLTNISKKMSVKIEF